MYIQSESRLDNGIFSINLSRTFFTGIGHVLEYIDQVLKNNSFKNEYYSFNTYANSKQITRENHRGSQLYFHITRYLLKEGRTHFLLPKVKVGFQHLFSLQKRFSLCSSHKINANIVAFC